MNDSDKEFTTSIDAIFGGILQGRYDELDNKAAAIPEDIIVKLRNHFETFDIEMMNFDVFRHVEDFQEAAIIQVTAEHRAQFIILNYNYVENNFNHLFNKIEGLACCADKSRTVTRKILHSLVTGNEIVWNYEQEYTYHLPKIIFTTHEEIMEYFEGLYSLYYGNPTQYLTAMQKILIKGNEVQKESVIEE